MNIDLKMKKKRPVNILLVEDNPGDIRLAQEAFKEVKIKINLSIAMNGVEALDILRKKTPFEKATTPDLIILDLNLPKKNGIEVLSEIKNDERLRSIPVVVLTTSSAEQDVLSCYSSHVNCYIRKPVDYDLFFNVVRKIEEFWLSTAVLPSMM